MSDFVVFDVAFRLQNFNFLAWLQLSRVNKFCRGYFNVIFPIWQKRVQQKLTEKLGELGENLFPNNFHVTGSFLLGEILGEDYGGDVDILQDNSIARGKLEKERYNTKDPKMVCEKHNLEPNKCGTCNRFIQALHQWDALEKIRPLLLNECAQYPPGYDNDASIFTLETYAIPIVEDMTCAGPQYKYLDFITLAQDDMSTRDFVRDHDFSFVRNLYDGKSLLISDLDSIISRKTKFTPKILNRNLSKYNHSGDLSPKNLQKERIEKYKNRGFTIKLTKNVKNKLYS